MKNILKKITAKMGYQTDKKQILLLSDDWGSVRIKSKEDQADLIKKGYKADIIIVELKDKPINNEFVALLTNNFGTVTSPPDINMP